MTGYFSEELVDETLDNFYKIATKIVYKYQDTQIKLLSNSKVTVRLPYFEVAY